MLKPLSYEEFALIYKQRIKEDFPPEERRPLYLIRKLYHQQRYICLTLEKDGCCAAYATFIYDSGVDSVFLDYFAVDKSQRGDGIGSAFLPMLRQYWSYKGGIILECEMPQMAGSTQEQTLRERRIEFYKRLGAEITPWHWTAFRVDYNVLYLPITKPAGDTDISDELMRLYSFSMPDIIRRKFIKIKPLEN